MKNIKKLAVLLFTFLLLFPATVKAENVDCKVVSSYYNGENIYVFLKNNSDNPECEIPENASLMVNNSNKTVSYDAVLENVSDTQIQKNYFLLIDLSTSMPKYLDEIKILLNELLSDKSAPVSVTIGGFGEKFEIISENLYSSEEVIKSISNIQFTHQATDIRGGIVNALKYIGDNPLSGGTVSNIIMITDAVPWPESSDYRADEIADVISKITETPETILHSAIFEQSDNEELIPSEEFKNALSLGSGIYTTVMSAEEAASAGSAISDFVNDLSYFKFTPDMTMTTPRFDGKLLFKGDDNTDTFLMQINNIRNYLMELPEDNTEIPEFVFPYDNPEPTVESETFPETQGEIPYEDGTVPYENSDELNTAPTENTQGSFSFTILIIIGAALVIILIAAVYIIFRRNKYSQSSKGNNSVTLKLEILKGNPRISKHIYHLDDSLIIGSDRTSDIIIKDPDMPPKSAKVFLNNQSIFIEALSADVFIEGIPIHEPNKIRSGDKITIANVTFMFRF